MFLIVVLLFLNMFFIISFSGSEDKTHQATNQSETPEVTDNDDVTVGDRWDDEEDWGSLEVEPFI